MVKSLSQFHDTIDEVPAKQTPGYVVNINIISATIIILFIPATSLLISGCGETAVIKYKSLPGTKYLFPIHEGNYYGYINQDSNIVFEPQFQAAADFSEGLAFVKYHGRATIINEKGDIIKRLGHFIVTKYSEGLAYYDTINKVGFLDINGDWVIEVKIETEADGVNEFKEGLA